MLVRAWQPALCTVGVRRRLAGRLSVNSNSQRICLRWCFHPVWANASTRTGFLGDDGHVRLKTALPECLKLLLVVAYHVGNRLGELLKLRWSEVDFNNNQIRLNP
jgi:integrase